MSAGGQRTLAESENIADGMSVTPDRDSAPWQPPPGYGQPPPPSGPPVEPVRRQGVALRWIVALLATILVVVAIALVFVLANRPAAAGGLSPLAEYAAADSEAYLELRLDLPGDQRDRLVSFMSHFPGFADPATFEQKISDTLDQLLRRASEDELQWKRDIEPWFGGQLAFVATSLERSEGTPEPGLIALSVEDRARLEQFIAQQNLLGGLEQSEYRGQQLWSGRVADERITLALTDDALLLSKRVEDVQAALDVKAGERAALVTNEQLLGQLDDFHADRLVTFYFNGASLAGDLEGMSGALGSGLGNPAAALAGTVVGEVRAEADHLLVHFRMRAREGEPLPTVAPNRQTGLAERFPADSVIYVEMREMGQAVRQSVRQLLEALSAGGEEPPQVRQFEEFLGTRPEDFLDFLGDGAISFSQEGARYSGGLVANVSDENIARQRLERLASALRAFLAFGAGDSPVTIVEEQHGDATLTIFRFGDGVGADIPFSSISYTVSDGQLLLGVDDFVSEALDRTAQDSLAGSARYSAALEAVGAENAGVGYLDISTLRSLVEETVPAEERAFYERELEPYVEPFAYMIVAAFSEEDELVGRLLLYVE